MPSAIATPNSSVEFFPPISGVRTFPLAKVSWIARSMASAAFVHSQDAAASSRPTRSARSDSRSPSRQCPAPSHAPAQTSTGIPSRDSNSPKARSRSSPQPPARGPKECRQKIRSHHHVKPVRMPHKMRRQNIDVILIRPHVRKFLRPSSRKHLIPERHGMNDPVRFRGRGQMLLSLPRQFKRIAQNPVHAAPRKDALLHRHLFIGAFINPPADIRILAFVVFADDARNRSRPASNSSAGFRYPGSRRTGRKFTY